MEERFCNFKVLWRMFIVVMAVGLVFLILICYGSFDLSMNFMKSERKQQQQQHMITPALEKHSLSSNLSDVPFATEVITEIVTNQKGPLHVEFSSVVKLDKLIEEGSVSPGGRFRPKECVSQQKVAIIIPFRDRELHLKYWLYYMHPILQRQQLDYGVYVIEQTGADLFNRAKLFNVGYAEALKEDNYDCFVFSDIDIIPIDDRNLYKCYDQPRHLSVAIDKFNFQLPYPQIFGGISALSKEQLLKINGFSNNYWGWGGEDDDIYKRLSFRGMSISRPDLMIGRCKMIQHERDKLNPPNPQRMTQLSHTIEMMDKDGINSLSYSVVSSEKSSLYTRISVNIGSPPAL
ncbi:beta-1,4-galactosyltransferase 1 [Silurus meridionalis]|nr:beta-1,4-galactosyltransferase 1 [Silurus meridionalis]